MSAPAYRSQEERAADFGDALDRLREDSAAAVRSARMPRTEPPPARRHPIEDSDVSIIEACKLELAHRTMARHIEQRFLFGARKALRSAGAL